MKSLYYPYHPPEASWLRHALLYYDEVSTTVPVFMEKDGITACRLPEHLRRLRDIGQYSSIGQEVGYRKLLEEVALINPAFDFAKIGGAEDFAFMMFMNPDCVAHDSIRDEGYLFVDFLVEAAAALSRDVVVPATDKPKSYRALYNDTSSIQAPSLATGMHISYSELLPTPSPNTTLEDIVNFKKSRRDELLQLRIAMNEFSNALTKAESLEELKAMLGAQSAKVELGVSSLSKALRADGISTTLGVIKELVTINPPTLASLLTVGVSAGLTATGGNLKGAPLTSLLSGVAIASTILISSSVVGFQLARREKLENYPFAYLHLAQASEITS